MALSLNTHRLSVIGLLTATIVWWTACSDGDTVSTQLQESGVPVVFTADVQGSGLTRSAQTVDHNRWTANEEIAISDATADSPKRYKAASSSETDGGSVTFNYYDNNNIIYWPADKRDMRYDAWYPYSVARPTQTPTVPADQTSLTPGNYDLLYAPGSSQAFVQGNAQYPEPQAVSLTFYHQMVRIIVNIEIQTDDTWGSIVIGNGSNNIGRTRAVTTLGVTGDDATDDTRSTWGTLTDKNQITPKQISADGENKRYSYECMIPPQEGTNDYDLMTITTNVNGGGTRTYNYKTHYNFQAGYIYTYNLGLSIRGITMTATIQDWNGQTLKNVSDPLLL